MSGRADVYIETNITSHWTSLAVLSELGGIMRVKDWSVEETRRRSVPAVVGLNGVCSLVYTIETH